ncbi:hypothetical protein TNIN_259401 [Trichonephila inaurata madagascariensis]|uniref:Uncharacterized protein n=1 Tax=Trichonephila inaurata madagascariensis TaxID=2747483 RepID=A0A8X6XZP8_9ARAC|nr:hypothetical protein TNIN_259401 [Trichonephila inaurata madagascariensis]
MHIALIKNRGDDCAIPPHIQRYNSFGAALGTPCIQRVGEVRTTSEDQGIGSLFSALKVVRLLLLDSVVRKLAHYLEYEPKWLSISYGNE